MYLLYDGRWMTDPDRALVLCVADTLDEAIDDTEMFGDWVMVNDEGGEEFVTASFMPEESREMAYDVWR